GNMVWQKCSGIRRSYLAAIGCALIGVSHGNMTPYGPGHRQTTLFRTGVDRSAPASMFCAGRMMLSGRMQGTSRRAVRRLE
ncbi:hypothetical protein, partial [Sodalis sp.]|uniref:hypothetical protein n=1 Tax=Sodalis sp. (in: enterobacteria) TaxID=1898979 RepID=UPI003872F738